MVDVNGATLNVNNSTIIRLIQELVTQRNELDQLIHGQQTECNELEANLERITNRLHAVRKSLEQRYVIRDNYNVTIDEAIEKYQRLVDVSAVLLKSLTNEAHTLEETMNETTAHQKGALTNSNNDKQELIKSQSVHSQRMAVDEVQTMDDVIEEEVEEGGGANARVSWPQENFLTDQEWSEPAQAPNNEFSSPKKSSEEDVIQILHMNETIASLRSINDAKPKRNDGP